MTQSSNVKVSASQCELLSSNFGLLYNQYLPKIKKSIRKLDAYAGYKRTVDGVEDLAQGFFTEVWAKKWMQGFDLERSKKSSDPILTYLKNHLRNFYASKRTADIRETAVKENIMEQNKIKGSGYIQNFEFCYDVKRKLHKALFKTFNLLEKKAWGLFMYNNHSIKKAATTLGVSVGTAFLLKDSIYNKAQKVLEGYYSGSMNF